MICIINRQRHWPIFAQVLKPLALETFVHVCKSYLLKFYDIQNKFDINIVFVGDRVIHRLNREFRGMDSATDVLSFSSFDFPSPYNPIPSSYTWNPSNELLGEIVISTQTASRYAQKQGISFPFEIKKLVIHGVLHLCGYDHEVDNGEMKKLEYKLRRKLITDKFNW